MMGEFLEVIGVFGVFRLERGNFFICFGILFGECLNGFGVFIVKRDDFFIYFEDFLGNFFIDLMVFRGELLEYVGIFKVERGDLLYLRGDVFGYFEVLLGEILKGLDGGFVVEKGNLDFLCFVVVRGDYVNGFGDVMECLCIFFICFVVL